MQEDLTASSRNGKRIRTTNRGRHHHVVDMMRHLPLDHLARSKRTTALPYTLIVTTVISFFIFYYLMIKYGQSIKTTTQQWSPYSLLRDRDVKSSSVAINSHTSDIMSIPGDFPRQSRGPPNSWLSWHIKNLTTLPSSCSNITRTFSIPLNLSKYKLWTSLNTDPQTRRVNNTNTILGYNIVIQEIWKHQHPKDCSAARYVVMEPSSSRGFGSEFHAYAYNLAFAMNLGRVLMLDPHTDMSMAWQVDHEICKSQNKTNLDCYFEPWSSCTWNDVLASELKPGETWEQFSARKTYVARMAGWPCLNKLCVNLYRDHKVVYLKELLGDRDMFPSTLIEATKCFSIRPEHRHYWWRAIATTYLIRPNQATLQWLESMEHHVDITPQDTCAAMYIRRARDKIHREMNAVETHRYVDTALQWFSEESQLKQLGRKVIFVGSEDEQAIEETKKLVQKMNHSQQGQEYHVVYTNLFDRSQTIAKFGLHRASYTPVNATRHPLEYLSMILNLQQAVRCHMWVCALKSTWCTIIDELRVTLGAKLTNVFVDLTCLSKQPCLTGFS